MRYLRYLLILALLALALWHLWPYFDDLKGIIKLKDNLNYIWLAMSVLALAGQYYGDGWLSQILLRVVGQRINVKDTLKIASIDVFAAHLLPIGEAGVIATAAYFYRRLGVSNQGIIFLTIAWGTITNIILILFLIISALFLPHLPNFHLQVSELALILIGLLILASPIFVLKKNFFWQIIQNRFSKYKLFKEILIFFKNLRSHKEAIFKNKKLIFKAFLAAFIYYAANIASLYFSFLAFGKPPPIALVTFTYLISLIAAFITLAPAGIGATESTMIISFLQFNVEPSLTIASVLLFRLFSFWLPIPIGAFAYFSMKKNQNGQNS